MDENEAKSLAEEINAVFQKTSAKSANGIDDLFIKIGIKFLEKNPPVNNIQRQNINSNNSIEEKKNKKENGNLSLSYIEDKPKKRCC